MFLRCSFFCWLRARCALRVLLWSYWREREKYLHWAQLCLTTGFRNHLVSTSINSAPGGSKCCCAGAEIRNARAPPSVWAACRCTETERESSKSYTWGEIRAQAALAPRPRLLLLFLSCATDAQWNFPNASREVNVFLEIDSLAVDTCEVKYSKFEIFCGLWK